MKLFCFHNWARWSDPIAFAGGFFQLRCCTKCGIFKRRWVNAIK